MGRLLQRNGHVAFGLFFTEAYAAVRCRTTELNCHVATKRLYCGPLTVKKNLTEGQDFGLLLFQAGFIVAPSDWSNPTLSGAHHEYQHDHHSFRPGCGGGPYRHRRGSSLPAWFPASGLTSDARHRAVRPGFRGARPRHSQCIRSAMRTLATPAETANLCTPRRCYSRG